MNADGLPGLIESFVNAETFEECRRLLNDHPELLNEEKTVDEVLKAVTHGSDDERSAILAKLSLSILEWCRLVGVPLTFAVLNVILRAGPDRATVGKATMWIVNIYQRITRSRRHSDLNRFNAWMRDHSSTASHYSWDDVKVLIAQASDEYAQFTHNGDRAALNAAISKVGPHTTTPHTRAT